MTEMTKPSPLHMVLIFFRAILGAYGLGIILYTLIVFVFGERWIFIEFMKTFAQLIWLPTMILVPICLIMREWRLTVMLLPGLLSFLVIWGDLFLPNTVITSQNNDIAIRVLSYNLYVRNSYPDRYLNLIREADADIVALQELNYPQAEILQSEFAETYPYMAFHPGGTQGQGIMSRYPILADEYWQYDFLLHALGHQRVELEINANTHILIYNVHPSHPGMQGQYFNPEFRSQEIADLLNRTANETLPIIMLGDFNMPDFSNDYNAIRNNFSDAFRDSGYGLGWTFPNLSSEHTALLRLDYIFYTDIFIPQNAIVWARITGSDHNALSADLLIRFAASE